MFLLNRFGRLTIQTTTKLRFVSGQESYYPKANTILSQTISRSFTCTPSLFRHPGIVYPYHLSRQWAVKKLFDPNQYTTDPVPLARTGGRGPDGRIKYKHITTGLNRPWFMVDYNRSRHMSTGQPYEELVIQVKKNWWRTPFIALVASAEVKRWIVATTSMKPGDIIKSHVDIPIIPVDPKEGDAHPVGALPVGTTICQLELRPGEGALRCRAAGTNATVVRRGKYVGNKSPTDLQHVSPDDLTDEDIVLVRENGKRKLLRLLPSCMAVVGQVSNSDHNKQKYRKFGEKYWHGIKQRSGLWQRKTGRFGRKIRPIGPPLDYVQPEESEAVFVLKCTKPEDPEIKRQKQRILFNALNPGKTDPIQPEPKASNGLPDNLPRFRWCTWASVR